MQETCFACNGVKLMLSISFLQGIQFNQYELIWDSNMELIPESAQGQVGWGVEQPGLVEG